MDYSRQIADYTAERLQALGNDALALLELLGTPASASPDPGQAKTHPVDADQIGLWSRHADATGVSYVRGASRPASGWRLARERWADVDVIPAKSTRRRIVLLGESVARGYFYDPLYTPASVLQMFLNRHLPEGAEVIDLAANDLSSTELLDLLSRVPALAPDALVIFAGNNWAPALLRLTVADRHARHQAAAALRSGGVSALKRMLEDHLSHLISEQLRMLPRVLQAMKIPAVLVVPEFNLVDWHDDPSHNAAWLAGDGNRQWWDHHVRARQALEDDNPRLAREHAEAMLALDSGLAHNGLEIIGTVLAAAGERAQAREALERARDGRIWDIATLSPRCYTRIQEGLRHAASAHVRVVDLPDVLSGNSASRLPNRSMFMDYCHLTASSIAVAMAHVAHAVAPEAGLPPIEALCAEPGIRPAPEVESLAHLLAAIHNAHWGQAGDTVRHHLRIAAQSKKTCDLLRLVLDLHGRRAPAWMTPSAAALLQGQSPQLARYFLAYDRGRLFDEHLLDSIAETLERFGDENASQRLAARRKSEWSVQSRIDRVDLLGDVWTHHADQSRPAREQARGAAGVGPMRGWYRAYAPVSHFPVVSAAAGAAGLHLEITCRSAPFFVPEGEGLVRLNGERIGTLPLRSTWQKWRIEIPVSSVRAGVNRLELAWPLGDWQSEAALDAAASGLAAGRLLDLTPAFADLWSLWLEQTT